MSENLLDTAKPDNDAGTTAEAPAEGVTPEAGEGAQAPTAEPTGAPAEYGDFVLPEGLQADPELTTELKTVARELNLTQAQAQRLADLGVKSTQKQLQAIEAHVERQRDAWADETRADAEIGGAALQESLSHAKRALSEFGSPKLLALLNESGAGNHPEVIRAFAKMGRAMAADKVVPASRPVTERNPAKILFPNQN